MFFKPQRFGAKCTSASPFFSGNKERELFRPTSEETAVKLYFKEQNGFDQNRVAENNQTVVLLFSATLDGCYSGIYTLCCQVIIRLSEESSNGTPATAWTSLCRHVLSEVGKEASKKGKRRVTRTKCSKCGAFCKVLARTNRNNRVFFGVRHGSCGGCFCESYRVWFVSTHFQGWLKAANLSWVRIILMFVFHPSNKRFGNDGNKHKFHLSHPQTHFCTFSAGYPYDLRTQSPFLPCPCLIQDNKTASQRKAILEKANLFLYRPFTFTHIDVAGYRKIEYLTGRKSDA